MISTATTNIEMTSALVNRIPSYPTIKANNAGNGIIVCTVTKTDGPINIASIIDLITIVRTLFFLLM